MTTWLDRWPGLLEQEEELLRQAGMDVERDEYAYRNGMARLTVRPKREGLPDELVVLFPDSFPYFRVEILSHELSLPKHQNPIGKNLCLMDRHTDSWTPYIGQERNTVLSLIERQIPDVIAANNRELLPEDRPAEVPQAEPVSEYIVPDSGAVFVDGDWSIPEYVKHGQYMLGIRAINDGYLNAAVLDLVDQNGMAVASASNRIKKLYGKNIVLGSWSRGAPTLTSNRKERHKQMRNIQKRDVRAEQWGKFMVESVAVVFKEEQRVGEIGNGWQFSFYLTRSSGKKSF